MNFLSSRIFPGLAALAVATVFASKAGAAEASDSGRRADSTRSLEQKLDRMDGKLDDIHQDVRVIREEAIESPLGNRSWGVEVNPLYILFLDNELTFSGTVSNFSWKRSGEFALPVWYSTTDGDDASTIFNLDPQYRHFLGSRQKGFYISGFMRYQYAEYLSYDDVFNEETSRHTLNRLGLGFGLGYRIFSRSGIYWGWNVSAGRFLLGDEVDGDDLPNRPSLWMGDLILDLELLKIGFAF